jgi:hypothetical protein
MGGDRVSPFIGLRIDRGHGRHKSSVDARYSGLALGASAQRTVVGIFPLGNSPLAFLTGSHQGRPHDLRVQ